MISQVQNVSYFKQVADCAYKAWLGLTNKLRKAQAREPVCLVMYLFK